MTYHVHATTLDGHYLGHVTVLCPLHALLLAGAATLLLPGVRFEIQSPVRKPERK